MFTEEYIQKVRELLLSNDEKNLLLGINLVSKEFPEALLQDFYALSLLQESGDIYQKIRKIFKKNAPENWWKFSIKKRIEKYDDIDLIEEKLEKYCTYEKVDKKLIAWYVLNKEYKGLRFALKYPYKSEEEIFKILIEDGYFLDLRYYHLKEFPKAILNLKQIKDLDIGYNDFTEIPEEITELSNLESIEIDEVPLTEESLTRLENHLPAFFADKYANNAGRLLHRIVYNRQSPEKAEYLQESKKCLDKAVKLEPDNAMAWNNFSVYWKEVKKPEKALKCIKKAIQYDKAPETIFYYSNMSSTLLALKKHQESLEICDKGIEKFKGRKNTEPSDYSKLYAWKALTLFREKDYKESVEVNLKATQLNPQNSMALYNIACAYAMLKNKEAMLNFLGDAIICSSRHKGEAQKDKDFEAYWNDEDFKKMVT